MSRLLGLIVSVVVSIVLECDCLQSAWADQAIEVNVISSRPDMVSGGGVLVELSATSRNKWVAQLNGHDVTSSFHRKEDSDRFIAVLTGLGNGGNLLEIRINGTVEAKLEIVNHPLTGPIFSGPHQQPFICQTETNGLGLALDADCTVKTRVEYYYKSTQAVDWGSLITASRSLTPGSLVPTFKVFDPSGPMPSDVARTTISDGTTVNYIVRREIGTINRAIYDIQFLHQPGQPLPSPWARPSGGWNGRLVYVFGGGCGVGYRQGTLGVVGHTQEPLLAQGYAVATSTLNIFDTRCNPAVSAETLSMVKEHFIKEYGTPLHTIGWGTSGGAMQLYLIAQNYPGLLDGIIPVISFPDMTSIVPSITDCALLDHAFSASKQHWTEGQKAAVSGYATFRTCRSWGVFGGGETHWPVLNAHTGCDPVVPKEMIYDKIVKPNGVRCDFYENNINTLGSNPQTGFARRPLDDVGVQYGLVAFNRGKIDAEQFVELNEEVGGYDRDGNIVSARTEADPQALRIAYEGGLVLTGGGGLNQIPIIDWRPYSDDGADQHDDFRSLVTRTRLIAANGNADNQIILVDARYELPLLYLNDNWNDPDARFADRERNLVPQMDRWLDNIAADRADGTLFEKVVRDKPADLADGCRATDGEQIVEPAAYGAQSQCNRLYPPHADPRIAAGAPVTDDVLKCELKPLDVHDYVQPLTPGQLQRLRAVFPAGVCDFNRLGVGHAITRVTWQVYKREQEAKAYSPPITQNH
jgi:hypothetical protein